MHARLAAMMNTMDIEKVKKCIFNHMPRKNVSFKNDNKVAGYAHDSVM